MRLRIISGGQTGADQAALRAARLAGLPTAGFAPKGFLTEAGPAPALADFGLTETGTTDYRERTRANVEEADALLWFGNPYSPGGKLTTALACDNSIPQFVVMEKSTPGDVAKWLENFVFLGENEVDLLVAGNRESKSPGIGARVESFLTQLFARLDLTSDYCNV